MRHPEYPYIHAKHTIRFIKWALHADGKRELTDIMEVDAVPGARRRIKKLISRIGQYELERYPGCEFVITEERAPVLYYLKDNERFPTNRKFTPRGRVITPKESTVVLAGDVKSHGEFHTVL